MKFDDEDSLGLTIKDFYPIFWYPEIPKYYDFMSGPRSDRSS